MTSKRNPGTIEFAMQSALGMVRCDIKAATGRSESYWRKVSSPNSKARLSLADAMMWDRLLAAEGQPALFSALLEENARDAEHYVDVHESIAALQADVGEVSKLYYAMLRMRNAGPDLLAKLKEAAHRVSRKAIHLREVAK